MSSILARSLASISLMLATACADDGDPAALSTATLGDGTQSAQPEQAAPGDGRHGAKGEGAPPAGASSEPAQPTETSPPAARPAGDLAQLAAGNRAFAFDLFRAVSAERAGENVVLSPYGVSSALSMVYAGARRLTEAELGATLRFALPKPALHAAFADVSRQLAARDRGEGLRLRLGSNVWVQRDLPIVPDFEALLRRSYGGPPEPADFAGDPAGARATINARVAERTGAKIAELLQPSDVGPDTELVLTSAAYLSARWKTPLRAVAAAPFTNAEGTRCDVPAMEVTGTFPRARGEGWQAVALPYAGDALRLVAVLPDAGRYEAIEAEASAAWFDAVRGALKDEAITIGLPKLSARARTPLRGPLEALDLRSLFRGADLTGIAEDGVALDDVIHEAALELSGDATQAASESGAGAGAGAGAGGKGGAAVRFDRPFLYAIVDEPTGQILFLGRVLDPTE